MVLSLTLSPTMPLPYPPRILTFQQSIDTLYMLYQDEATTVAEYILAYEDLMKEITGVSELMLISFFINNLRPDIHRELLRRGLPSTLKETFALAQACEAHIEKAMLWRWCVSPYSIAPNPIPPPNQFPTTHSAIPSPPPALTPGDHHEISASNLDDPVAAPDEDSPPSLDPGDHQETSHPHHDDPVDELDEAPPPALDPDDHQEISDPLPNDSVDENVEDPPPALDPGDHPEIYVLDFSPADPFDVLNKDPPPILDHGLVFNVSERLASLDFTFTLFVSSKKKSLMMFAVESLFVHWMNRNAKEKIFDARQAQGGGRSVLFHINTLLLKACSEAPPMPLVAMIHAQAINFSCSSLVSVQIFLVHMMFGDLLNCGSFEDALQPLDDMSDRDDDTSETSLGHFDVAIYPLEQVADPSVSREFRATPLHGIGTIELLTFLLSDAGTPLSWVVGPGQQDIVKILLAHIANPHIAIGDGGATHVAADIGNKESVTCFLIAGGIFTLFTLYFGLGSLLSAFGYYQLKGCKGDSVGQQCTMPQDSREGLPDFHLEDKVNFEEGGNDAGLVS